MATIAPYGIYQAFDDNGDPLSGGFLYTYEAGTTTPKATYTTADGDIENDNPVELDASGQASVWLGDGGYKFKLTDSLGNIIFTTDDIGGSSDSAFGGQVNILTSNTAITGVYANSANVVTGNTTLSLLPVSEAGEGFYISVKNAGVSNVTIDPDAGETIDNGANLTIKSGCSALIICDGTEWWAFFYNNVTETGTNNFSGANTFSGFSNFKGDFVSENDGTLTIASGAITPTGLYHFIDTEGSSASDDLDTINNTFNGKHLILETVSSSRDVVITNAGNIVTPNGTSITLNSTADSVYLLYNGTLSKWIVINAPAQISPSVLTGKVLNGLIQSNNVSDATNDIDITAGSSVSDDGTTVMTVSSTYTKRSDASWAVGSGNGFLDTGAIGNGKYSVFQIQRPDTGVVDYLCSLSATAPTMPTNYTKKKLIGGFIRSGGTILGFGQIGTTFRYNVMITDVDVLNAGSSAVLRTLTVFPNTTAIINCMMDSGTTAEDNMIVTATSETNTAASVKVCSLTGPTGATPYYEHVQLQIPADASSQIRTRCRVGSTNDSIVINTIGYIDTRI